MSNIDNTLNERGETYGDFGSFSFLCQALKTTLRRHKGWERLSSDQKESVEMIIHKVSRIVNGDPNHLDSWVDIQGYARLSEKCIKHE